MLILKAQQLWGQALEQAPDYEGLRGRLPDPDEWGNDMAVGTVTSARSGTWSPAGTWKSAADYGRPETVPAAPMPVPLLPTIEDIGRGAFEAALIAAWGGPVVTLQDPTGAGVVLSKDYLLQHLPDDKRERFFGLIPDVLERPYEVWLQPQQSDISGRVVLRKVYIKLYAQDKKTAPLRWLRNSTGVRCGMFTRR
ncbi:MAG: hypothetical protein K6T57_15620 [Thermaceae bacterium]|nr:hypothetical protein [Thermaceae bacterium]